MFLLVEVRLFIPQITAASLIKYDVIYSNSEILNATPRLGVRLWTLCPSGGGPDGRGGLFEDGFMVRYPGFG
jgi:hypothetical protein